jgi:phosphoserine aminotransferase
VGSLKNTDAVICITQNETSNGTQVSNKVIGEIKSRNPEALIAIDATSSMGGVKLNFRAADIWFASVQKCFGLPAGLGLMFCSPKAIEEGKRIGEKSHYNSLSFMINMMEKWQTPFTPNVLGIYLLMRVLEDSNGIADTEKKVKTRYELWLDFLAARKDIAHLVENRKVHSYTVLPIQASEGLVDQIKKEAKKSGLLLGEGYGSFKPYTFRVANFPALKDREIKTLQLFLKDY